MGQKARNWFIGIVVFLILFVGLGPIFVAKVAKQVFKPKDLITKEAKLKIKARGTIKEIEKSIILVSPKDINKYVLEGARAKELKQFAGKATEVFIFGNLKRSDPKKLGDIEVKANIEVAEFDVKDFDIGTKMTDKIADDIKAKIKEKIEFREATLKKLGQTGSDANVIWGQLKICRSIRIVDKTPKEVPCLYVVDKFGDRYLLSNIMNGIGSPIEKFKPFTTDNFNVVVTGQFVVKDMDLTYVDLKNYTTLGVEKIYSNNGELTELVMDSSKAK